MNCSPDLPNSQGFGASRCVYVTKLFLTALWVLSCYISFLGTPGLFVLCLCHLKNKSWKEKWRGVQKIKVSLWDGRFIEPVSQRLESHTLQQKRLAVRTTLRTAALLVWQKHPTPDMDTKRILRARPEVKAAKLTCNKITNRSFFRHFPKPVHSNAAYFQYLVDLKCIWKLYGNATATKHQTKYLRISKTWLSSGF